MWIESDGEPEDDPCITKVVIAPNKHAALDSARLLVRDENPEVQSAKELSVVSPTNFQLK